MILIFDNFFDFTVKFSPYFTCKNLFSRLIFDTMIDGIEIREIVITTEEKTSTTDTTHAGPISIRLVFQKLH